MKQSDVLVLTAALEVLMAMPGVTAEQRTVPARPLRFPGRNPEEKIRRT